MGRPVDVATGPFSYVRPAERIPAGRSGRVGQRLAGKASEILKDRFEALYSLHYFPRSRRRCGAGDGQTLAAAP